MAIAAITMAAKKMFAQRSWVLTGNSKSECFFDKMLNKWLTDVTLKMIRIIVVTESSGTT